MLLTAHAALLPSSTGLHTRRVLLGFGSRGRACGFEAGKYRIDPIYLYYQFEYAREVK
jgi:hypothetical protein